MQPRSQDQRRTELQTTYQMSWHPHNVVSDGKGYWLGTFVDFLDVILKLSGYPVVMHGRIVICGHPLASEFVDSVATTSNVLIEPGIDTLTGARVNVPRMAIVLLPS